MAEQLNPDLILGNYLLAFPVALENIELQSRTVQCIDPLEDPRWTRFVERHPDGSVFHTTGWLCALRQTYGFDPLALTTSDPDGELSAAVLFCSIRSWITGSRFVSLPLSDHCEPLVTDQEDLKLLCERAESLANRERRKYVEMRPMTGSLDSIGRFRQSMRYIHHRLDLRPPGEVLFHRFHKDCVQRKIRRAEREGLRYETGLTRAHVDALYDLFCLSRKRHHAPPQPKQWFYNLVDHLRNHACIRIAYKAAKPVASLLTLTHGNKMFYKYGGSDAQFHKFGGMQMLLWRTIQEAKQAGCEELDMGRSGCHEDGLITFKDRWGARRDHLQYWRSPEDQTAALTDESRPYHYAKQLCSYLPTGLFALTGRLFYRHVA